MKLSIIIVSYNVRDLLNQCLISVQNSVKDIENEIIIADNNSDDGSRELLTNSFGQMKHLFFKENLGFAKACNQGYKISSGEYVLFLNPDTIVSGDCFHKCFSFFEATNDAGAVGIRMVDGKGKFLKESKRSFPTPVSSFFKLFGFAKLFPRSNFFAAYYAGHLPEHETNPVDVLSGAFMLIRKEVLEKTGGFDEIFFMYGEDIDMSYRIVRAGYRNYYLGGITITHLKGGSTRYDRKQIDHFYKAMQLFIEKHYSDKHSLFYTGVLYAGIGIRKWIAKLGLVFR